MADSAIMADLDVPAIDEIQNMKVTDLRKKLRAFGLPIGGNKTELIERLQEACLSSKGQDSFDSSNLGFDESHISELDSVDSSAIEENALLDQDQFSSYINSSLEDDSKVLGNTESKLSAVSNSVIMPLKKRSLSKTGDGTVVEKKMLLNRTNVTHIDFDIKVGTEDKPEAVTTNNTTESEEKRVLSVKNMSAAERLAMRAKRFNVIGNATVVTTNSKSTINKNSKQSILSSTIAPDLNVLKKRAERFGQSVSNVMKQIEQKEKLLKRKCKFGANLAISATSSLDEQVTSISEKKRRRAERFGIS